MSHHVGTVRAHGGLDVHVHVGERDAHVIVSVRGDERRDGVPILSFELSPIVGRALSRLIQTAAHEAQRIRSGRKGRAP